MLEGLRVTLGKNEGGAVVKLGDVAQVIPKGRVVDVLVGEIEVCDFSCLLVCLLTCLLLVCYVIYICYCPFWYLFGGWESIVILISIFLTELLLLLLLLHRFSPVLPLLLPSLRPSIHPPTAPSPQSKSSTQTKNPPKLTSPAQKQHLKPLTTAILSSTLSLTPQPDPTGTNPLLLHIAIPPPTAESRSLALAAATKAGETANLAVRNARQACQKKLRAMQLAKTVRPDDLKKAGALMEKVVEGRGTGEVKKVVEGVRRVLDS